MLLQLVWEIQRFQDLSGLKMALMMRVDSSGSNPHRQPEFGEQLPMPMFETPRLCDMRAKQGAIVKRFLTFFQRKCSLVTEL